jgi:ComF family protein
VDALRSHLGSATGRLLDLALPATCAGCGREGDPLCPRCRPALTARDGTRPGVPLGLPSDVPSPLLQLEWCAQFDGAIRRALHALKYAGEQRLTEPLGAALAMRWRRAGVGGDCLVHVPVHASRSAERGYDQAALLAVTAARHLGIPFQPALMRSRATVAQYRLDRVHRGSNVSGAFGVRPGFDKRLIAGHWPILVDDVVTTGATLSACGAVLLEAGAIGVSAVTIARER